MNSLFASIITNGTFTAATFAVSTITSLFLGVFIALVYCKYTHSSRSYAITLVMLPMVVELVILLVNGNIGAGVAIAGAFSLVRFRSAAGSGEEITSIFLAMAVGLCTGMGYITIAIVFTLIVMIVYVLLHICNLGFRQEVRMLRITVPETLDFEGAFDDVLKYYTEEYSLEDVRTSGMGSLYKLTYEVTPKGNASMKEMIDELRTRNGNLEIALQRPVSGKREEL